MDRVSYEEILTQEIEKSNCSKYFDISYRIMKVDDTHVIYLDGLYNCEKRFHNEATFQCRLYVECLITCFGSGLFFKYFETNLKNQKSEEM